jgi:DNA-binding transcriptional regulator YdaS (Cro superfamily)
MLRMSQNPATRLVARFGSNAEVAKHFSVTREAVRLWLKNGIPPDRALEVEERTEGEVTAMEVLNYAKQQKDEARAAPVQLDLPGSAG